MRPLIALLLMAATGLPGCVGVAVYGESRRVVRQAVMPMIAEEVPGVAPADSATCVVKGMTTAELLRYPNSDTIKTDAAFRPVVRRVLARPKVVQCLAAAPTQTAAPAAKAP